MREACPALRLLIVILIAIVTETRSSRNRTDEQGMNRAKQAMNRPFTLAPILSLPTRPPPGVGELLNSPELLG